jgi:hypothetical protein
MREVRGTFIDPCALWLSTGLINLPINSFAAIIRNDLPFANRDSPN